MMPFIAFRLIMRLQLLTVNRRMKNFSFALLLLSLTLSGCGQPGPLYLPGTKPPFYVPPEPEPEAKGEEAEQDKATEKDKDNKTDKEKSPEPSTPENKQPTTEQ
jgi:predicted small lipoprotein YifL